MKKRNYSICYYHIQRYTRQHRHFFKAIIYRVIKYMGSYTYIQIALKIYGYYHKETLEKIIKGFYNSPKRLTRRLRPGVYQSGKLLTYVDS